MDKKYKIKLSFHDALIIDQALIRRSDYLLALYHQYDDIPEDQMDENMMLSKTSIEYELDVLVYLTAELTKIIEKGV